MKLKLLTAVAATAMMAVPSIASADDEGWYLRGNVGYGTHNDMDFIENDIGLVGDVESEGNVAYTLGAGYDFGNNWRVELDGSDLWTDLGAVGNISPSFAKLRTTGIFVNALYDFEEFGNWEPYVGAGIGYVKGKLDAEAHGIPVPGTAGAVFQPNGACNGGASFNCNFNDDSAGSLGWQLLAGMGYDISDNLTWDTHYRYQNAGDMDFDGVVSPLWGSVAGQVAGRSTLEDIGAHMLMTGLRYKFGEAKPMVTCWDGSEVKMIGQCPAQPVMVSCWDGSSFEEGTGTCPDRPVVRQTITCWDGSSYEEGSGGTCPPERQTFLCWDNSVVYDSQDNCPTQAVISDRGNDVTSLCSNQYRQEIIYYEFDKGQSPETRATVGRILDIGEYCRVDNIRVVGHTDTSGSAAYNLALSQRRAKDARDELVRQGINGSVITSEGKGETEPFVPTGDGVKEQLNRRTEVLITLSEVGVIN